MEQWIGDVAKVIGPAILSFFAGRASKNRELMSSDLEARTQEFRELVGAIGTAAVDYWESDQDAAANSLGEDLTRRLHKMQALRVYCSAASAGYKTGYIRQLEDNFGRAPGRGVAEVWPRHLPAGPG